MYQRDGVQKKILLDFGDYVFTKDDISENFTHSQITNPTGDFVIGLASKAQLTFDINNLYQLIPDEAITGREFIYKAGLLTETHSKKEIYKKIRKDIVCLGAVAYAGNTKTPYLTIWDLEGKQLTAPEQPSQPVKSLFIVDNKLYCGHDKSPYLTAYSISGNTLKPLAAPQLNPFQADKIKNYNKRAASFNMKGGNALKEYFVEKQTLIVNDEPETTLVDFTESTTRFSQIGIFIAELPERKNDIAISVTAYDLMKKFDVVIDAWNATLKYPITATGMLQSLCAHVGVELDTVMFLNDGYKIQKNYRGQNVTGIQVVQWIAQLAACFACVDEYGRLTLRWYADRGYTIDESSYTDVTIAAFETAPVDKVQIQVTENDLGVIVPNDAPTKTNALIIENNPLLYATSDAELRPAATNIYNAVTKFAYHPFSIKTIWGDPRRRVGDIVTIKTLKGQLIKAPIMNFKTAGINSLRGEYSATGGQTRSKQVDAVNQRIDALRMRSNELVMDLEKTQNTLTSVSTKVETVTDSVTGLSENVETITTEVGDLKLTSKDFSVRLSSTEQSVNSVTGELTTTNQKVASLELSLEGFLVTLDSAGLSFTKKGFFVNYSDDKNKYQLSLSEGKFSSTETFLANGSVYGISLDGREINFISMGSIVASIWAYEADGEKKLVIDGKIGEVNCTFANADFLSFEHLKTTGLPGVAEANLLPHLVKTLGGYNIQVFGARYS